MTWGEGETCQCVYRRFGSIAQEFTDVPQTVYCSEPCVRVLSSCCPALVLLLSSGRWWPRFRNLCPPLVLLLVMIAVAALCTLPSLPCPGLVQVCVSQLAAGRAFLLQAVSGSVCPSNKCIASSNKCLTSSNHFLFCRSQELEAIGTQLLTLPPTIEFKELMQPN